MAYGLLKTEEDFKQYLENLATEYKFSCFKERNAEGCHLLANYLEAVKCDYEGSAKVLKSNCDELNYGKSCRKFGNFSLLGKGMKPDSVQALVYYKKACQLNDYAGCLHAGNLLTSKDNKNEDAAAIELDYINGLKYLEKACFAQDVTACQIASNIYIRGADGVPLNKTKASELAVIACNNGSLFSCINLSLMYARGDGVEKNKEKSQFYKQKAKDIREDERRKPPIGLQQYI